jgi:hypothetical protein
MTLSVAGERHDIEGLTYFEMPPHESVNLRCSSREACRLLAVFSDDRQVDIFETSPASNEESRETPSKDQGVRRLANVVPLRSGLWQTIPEWSGVSRFKGQSAGLQLALNLFFPYRLEAGASISNDQIRTADVATYVMGGEMSFDSSPDASPAVLTAGSYIEGPAADVRRMKCVKGDCFVLTTVAWPSYPGRVPELLFPIDQPVNSWTPTPSEGGRGLLKFPDLGGPPAATLDR